MAHYTLAQTIPHLIALFRDPSEITNRPATLTALETLIRAVSNLFQETKALDAARTYGAERPLDTFKDEILGVFTVGLKVTGGTPQALAGLDAMVNIPDLLADEEVGFVVHSINEVLASTTDSADEVRYVASLAYPRITNLRPPSLHSGIALAVLSTISHIAPKHVESTTLPLLFSSLPDTAPPRSSPTLHTQYRLILSNLTSLCTTPPLFETLVIRLSTKLDLICANTSPDSDQEANAAYVHSALSSLSTVLATKVRAGDKDVPKYLERLVPHLYEVFIGASVRNGGVASHPRVIQIGSKIIQQIVQTVSLESVSSYYFIVVVFYRSFFSRRQQSFYESLFKAFFENQISDLIDDRQGLFAVHMFQPFEVRFLFSALQGLYVNFTL